MAEIPNMTFEQFAAKYCEKQKQTPEGLLEILRQQKKLYAPIGWMMLECHQLDSSRLGSLTILVYGPNNTLKAVPENRGKFFLHQILKVWLGACLWLSGTIIGGAAPLTEDNAVRAIIGEAANQPYEGQVALAAALRNRGTLKGVYGFSAKVLPKHTARTVMQARLAWRDSEKRDLSMGATHWENTRAFGKPYWADSMRKTVLIGDHQFYAPALKRTR